jgi:O-antigen ligase
LCAVLLIAIGQGASTVWDLTKRATWWHKLWLLLFVSGLVFRVRESSTIRESPADFWSVFRIGLVGLVGLCLLARLSLNQTPWLGSLFRGLVGVLASYALVSVVSTAWSVYPAWTLYKSVEYFVDLALVAAILVAAPSTENYKTLFDWTWLLYGLQLASVWTGALVWPQAALQRDVGLIGVQLYGVLPVVHANAVGDISAALGIVATRRLLLGSPAESNRALYFSIFGASLVSLVLSQTRSAIVGFVLGAVLLLFLSRRLVTIALLTVGSFLAGMTTVPDILRVYFLRGQTVALFQSFTGRVSWWEYAWQRFMEQPLAGYGAYAGGRFAVMEHLGATTSYGMHNTYMEVIVGTGLWGLLPLLLALLGIWWVLIRAFPRSSTTPLGRGLVAEALALLVLLTIRSFFETRLIWHPSQDFLVVLAFAEFLRRHPSRESSIVAQSVPAAWR